MKTKELEKPKTAEELFPKCNKLADEIASTVLATINRRRGEVKSEDPYSAQCTLELVIAKLERCV